MYTDVFFIFPSLWDPGWRSKPSLEHHGAHTRGERHGKGMQWLLYLLLRSSTWHFHSHFINQVKSDSQACCWWGRNCNPPPSRSGREVQCRCDNNKISPKISFQYFTYLESYTVPVTKSIINWKRLPSFFLRFSSCSCWGPWLDSTLFFSGSFLSSTFTQVFIINILLHSPYHLSTVLH